MNIKDVAFVFCRFFALYIFFSCLTILPFVFMNGINLDALISSLEFLLLFVLLWTKTDWISEKIVSGRSDSDIKTNFTIQELQNTGFIVIGMYILAMYVPAMFSFIADIITDERVRNTNYIISRLGIFFKIIVGIFLVFGNNAISRFIKKLRG